MLKRLIVGVLILAGGCSASDPASPETTAPAPTVTTTDEVPSPGDSDPIPDGALVDSRGEIIPPAPDVTTGSLTDEAIAAVETLWSSLETGFEPEDVSAIGATGDPRLAWLLADIMRFFQGTASWRSAVEAFNQLTGTDLTPQLSDRPWQKVNDYMIAWDVEAPPGYADYKRRLFTLVEPGWEPFFEDGGGDVDWRLVSWGGVFIDDRPLGDLERCARGCIPALDDPPVTDAAGGDWYADDGVVFAIAIDGEARAYPKNMMEVHEMVNDTIAGRRIGMPYCTLCGSAQAFLTDEVRGSEANLVLRTSGLLSRSNKVMYELNSKSVFDTFLGVALTGPLHDAGVILNQVAVVTTTWGEWKAAHPNTTIIAQDGGRGLEYPDDPLGGRDDNGPIFPVGDVDPRLGVQDHVLGVTAPDGTQLAFPVGIATLALEAGEAVQLQDVTLQLDGGGLVATTGDGAGLPTHQAFWFAWSQFHPDTLVWQP